MPFPLSTHKHLNVYTVSNNWVATFMLFIWFAFCLQFMNSFMQVTFKLIYTNVG